MKTYFFIALAMLCHVARAQDDPQPTLYLNTGKTLKVEKLRLRKDAFNSYYFLADGKRLQAEQVKFFQNERGFFANTMSLHPFRISGFAERIDRGRINLYRELPHFYKISDMDYDDQWDAGSAPTLNLYYNKGLDLLKKTTYVNLLVDLEDNPKSMDILAAYRTSKNSANIYFGVSGVSLLASFITFFNGSNQTSSGSFSQLKSPKFPVLSLGLIGIGAGFGVAGALKYLKSKDHLILAIDEYNR